MSEGKNLGELVDQLFAEVQAIKPAWRQSLRTQEELEMAKIHWAQALLDGGVSTIDAMRQGLRGVRADPSPFFPSPGQFVKWCWEWSVCDLDVPDVASAWQEVQSNCHRPREHRWSHLTVREAGARVGWWRLTHESGDTSRQDFLGAYMAVIREYLESGRLNITSNSDAVLSSADGEVEVASPEIRSRYLRDIWRILQ